VSTFQVTLRIAGVASLPQPSETFQVRVCERLQPSLDTEPVLGVGATSPQLSVAVAEPSAASMSAASGLQPRVRVVPVAVITGFSVSTVQVTVRTTEVAALPQPSEALQVRLCDRPQPSPTPFSAPSVAVGVTVPPQLSVAEAEPSAASI